MSAFAAMSVLAALAYVVNPRGDFQGERFPQVRPDYRTRKLDVLDRFARAHRAKGVVIGSSRSAKIDPQDLRQEFGMEFFNMSVLNADAEDYLATARLFAERQGTPRMILIGLDGDAFAAGDESQRFRNNLTSVAAFNGEPSSLADRVSHDVRLLKSTVTTGYMSDSWSSLRARMTRYEITFAYRDDGVLDYPRWERQIADKTFDRAALRARCVTTFRRQLRPVDSSRMKVIETVLREARANNTRVVMWIAPYHPDLVRAIDGDPRKRPLLAAFSEIVAKLATQYDATFVDLTHIEAYGGDAADFYDCVHFGRESARRIARVLAQADSLATAGRP